MLNILTSFWVLCTSNPDRNMLFQRFSAKNSKTEEKVKKLMQNLTKKHVFFGLLPYAGRGLYVISNKKTSCDTYETTIKKCLKPKLGHPQ